MNDTAENNEVNICPIVEERVTDKVVFEFNVQGMSCVACTGSIERLVKTTFGSHGLVTCSIVLLTSKMFCTFEAVVFHDKEVTPEKVCEEVEAIGFSCSLISITEMKGEEQLAKKRKKQVSTNTTDIIFRNVTRKA